MSVDASPNVGHFISQNVLLSFTESTRTCDEKYPVGHTKCD